VRWLGGFIDFWNLQHPLLLLQRDDVAMFRCVCGGSDNLTLDTGIKSRLDAGEVRVYVCYPSKVQLLCPTRR
jgi:hypothetical protein